MLWWWLVCLVFRHLRELFAIDPVNYMLAICGSDALREFSSPGKSGSFFYLTQDDRFMIKTVKKSEVKVSNLATLNSQFNMLQSSKCMKVIITQVAIRRASNLVLYTNLSLRHLFLIFIMWIDFHNLL
jgi:hypothetical protein